MFRVSQVPIFLSSVWLPVVSFSHGCVRGIVVGFRIIFGFGSAVRMWSMWCAAITVRFPAFGVAPLRGRVQSDQAGRIVIWLLVPLVLSLAWRGPREVPGWRIFSSGPSAG
ncbi:hypothetical protein T484DRAFT_1966623 [Baffinella frigidus]|nr:hypothetical protein T484DRAFT_1966623 [Cryptophyta sp. CCMP2293]